MINIQPIPVLKDNYTWFVRSSDGRGILIDPGEAAPVEAVVNDNPIEAIFLTHHHADHIAGANALRERYGAAVYGPSNAYATLDHILQGGETLTVAGIAIHVLASPGHAVGHLSYVLPEVPALFCGDVLFSGGSGRLLEGTAEELYRSLRAYDSLSDETLVCAGHEYTASNMAFIASLGIETEAFRKRRDEVTALRAKGLPTLPVTLGIERKTNPFLQAKDSQEFARLRQLKDHFRG
ncbi:hydroxyacylglutathione hydrolase [Saccharibacter sp. 17.LH.SD]|uniref:hydroxyacylglutathione hydrolase n=1 Tax=Saccharibacter sp. 17.LH.SD TaxID=2689393 RepID=UPI001928B04A|nr:hydroxyacylglutathione hydrolase [Saccharibacter sp. 17.LH.SD]